MMETRQIRRSGDVAQKLTDSIRKGHWQPGSFLPSARELAGRFGVSLNTIQIALRELETKRLIQCLPRKGSVVCDILPTAVASTMGGASADAQIGIIGPDYYISNQDQWTPRIIHAAEESLFQSQYRLSLLPGLTTGPNLLQRVTNRLDALRGKLSGIICLWDEALRPILKELDGRKLPWVCVNRPDRCFEDNYVAADNHRASQVLGRALALSGFERLLVISHPLSYFSMLERVTGLYQGYLEAGASTQGIKVVTAEGSGDEMSGYRALKSCMKDPLPQALFATGDDLALGAMRALEESGIAVPDQVSVIGSTGLRRAEQAKPALTVLAQPMEAIGETAALMLHQLILNRQLRTPGRRVPCRILVRESCRFTEGVSLE